MIPKFKAWDKIDKVIREVTAIDWSLIWWNHAWRNREKLRKWILMQSTEKMV
ncbi:hypothetical protein [Enterococcus avium]|uniref:hypothetical protein n=1 Tax=Enterococcus avium TaxID=33945 RepID=UPI00163D73E4|nr:hypothetical protein [Enterococcus avium]